MWWSLILSLITFYVAIRMWGVCAPVFLKQKLLIQNLLTPWGSTARPHVGCGGDCSLKALFSSCAHCLTTCPRLPCDYVQPCDWVRPMDCVQKCPHHVQAWPMETSHRSSSMLSFHQTGMEMAPRAEPSSIWALNDYLEKGLFSLVTGLVSKKEISVQPFCFNV